MGAGAAVPTSAYLAMADALAEAPCDAGDRFAGTPELQAALTDARHVSASCRGAATSG